MLSGKEPRHACGMGLLSLSLFSGNRGHGGRVTPHTRPSYPGIFFMGSCQATRGSFKPRSQLGPEVVISIAMRLYGQIGPVSNTIFKKFPCSEALAQSKSNCFHTGLPRPAQSRFCSCRVCNGRKPSGPAFPEGGRRRRWSSCAGNLALVKLTGDRATKRLSCSYPSRRPAKSMLVPIHAADIVSSPCARPQPEPPPLRRDLHKQVVMIKRVQIPQVDFS